MKVDGSVALVTGANRGLGREFAVQLLKRGASKVYATARDPESVEIPGVEALRIDVTDSAQIAAAAETSGDVSLLINNAGISTYTNLVTGDLDRIRAEMDTHFWGALRMVRAFAPILARNGGGAILDVLSVLSWAPYDGANAYSVAKAAEWSLTNAIRVELAGQGTQVTGLHLAAADTDMMAGFDIPKNDPVEVVREALDGLEAGSTEVVFDEASAQAKQALAIAPAAPAVATS